MKKGEKRVFFTFNRISEGQEVLFSGLLRVFFNEKRTACPSGIIFLGPKIPPPPASLIFLTPLFLGAIPEAFGTPRSLGNSAEKHHFFVFYKNVFFIDFFIKIYFFINHNLYFYDFL